MLTNVRGIFKTRSDTNDALFSVDRLGVRRAVPRAPQLRLPTLILAHANRYYYTASILMSVGFIFLALRMQNQEIEQKTMQL